MRPPFCRPECPYYDYVAKLETQSALIASLIKERDGLLLVQKSLVAHVDS